MTFPSPAALTSMRIGNDAGWLLAFHTVAPDGSFADRADLWFGADDVHAEIRAALPGGLEGGVYTITVERLPDDQYARLAAMQGDRRQLGVAKLYLFWRDAPSGPVDYLAGMVGLAGTGDITPATAGNDPVAVLAVTGVSRAVGARGVETTITCRERVFERLANRTLCGTGPGIDVTSLSDAITQTLRQLGIERESVVHPLVPPAGITPAAPPPATRGGQKLEYGTGGVECLRDLAGRIEEQTGAIGRGVLLLRSGALHVGPRPLPLTGAVKDMTVETGLVDTQVLEPLNTDPQFDRCANPTGGPLTRRQFKLICKGRPDLRPGDVLRFGLTSEDAPAAGFGAIGAIGALAASLTGGLLPSLGGVPDPSARIYVNSVEHRLGRTSGFVTTVTGVELVEEVPDWDRRSPARRRRQGAAPTSANPETEAARAVRAVGSAAAEALALPDVGEVRSATATAGSEPAQSLNVWRGLAAGDGESAQSARVDVQRPSPSPAGGVPYLTPFAFGSAGLVLPRYPGMRVAVDHRLGRADDPIVTGALWPAGAAPAAQPGDWWLILPSAVPPSERESLPDGTTTAPAPYTGTATDDLVDADGNRVIEAGELTIRVGAAALQAAGERPERADAQRSVTIEHADGGSKIVMEANGKIRIEAAADLEIKAVNVKVRVSGTMDVSAG